VDVTKEIVAQPIHDFHRNGLEPLIIGPQGKQENTDDVPTE
jgi:hypothetical protein